MRVSNIMLQVSDMEAAVSFWRDRVGLALTFSGPEFTFFQIGELALVLHQPVSIEPKPSDTEIVFEVDDVHEAFERMRRDGVPFEVELRPVTSDGQRSLLAAHFRDPDGNLASITGWVAQD